MSELTDEQIHGFVQDGFVKVEGAFPADLAAECRDFLWRETGCDPDDPTTWTKPVIRLMGYGSEPFRKAVNTPRLHGAFDQVVGPGRWVPRDGIGTFPIRFPSKEPPGDDGWHIDVSFPVDDPNDYSTYRVNVFSKGRALLMLFLFSDVSDNDAPTRIRIGSHLDVVPILEPAGDEGLGGLEFQQGLVAASAERPVALATGKAGDVYLCHPFLVHAAQPHTGKVPKFMAQPGLDPAVPFDPYRDGGGSPVEEAIRRGLRLGRSGRGH